MNDLRLAFRQLQKKPAFAITVVLTLALGIGANTAIFTLVQAVLLQSLPVANPASLYRIGDTDNCCVNGGYQSENGDFDLFSYELFLHLKQAAPEFEELAAFQSGYSYNTLTVRRGSEAARAARGEYVTGNYFSTFGIRPFLGRMLLPSDDNAGAAPVTVLSYQAWQNDYAGDPAVVGSTFYIQGRPLTVVGVAPPGFFGDRVDSNPPELWMPLSAELVIHGEDAILNHADANWLYAIGRLRRGVNIAALQEKLSASLRQWLATQETYVRNGRDSLIPKQHVVLTPAGGGVQNLQQETGKGLNLLMALSALVLLVACANVANILLARGATRRTETSLRVALGAARAHLIRQMLVESLLLGCIGGALGLAVAYAGTKTILALAFPDSKYLPIHASPSLPVLGFALAVSLLTGIVFGIVPAWISSRSDPAEALRGVNRSTRDSSSLPQKSLIIFQAALSLVLLVGASLLTKTLRNLEHQHFGIQTQNRYVVHLDPHGAGYTIDKLQPLYDRLERDFSALPGVKTVGLALYSPLEGNNWGEGVYIEGKPEPGPNAHNGSSWDRVSTHFFEGVGQPVIRGRNFTEQDTATSQMVAIVNQTFVKKFFPNEDPIGYHFGNNGQQFAGSYEIVGVVADAKYNNPRGEYRPFYYRPLTQRSTRFEKPSDATGENWSMFIDSIILRFESQPQSVDSLVRRTLGNIDPNLTVIDLRSMDYQVAGNFNQERLIARLTLLFGILALVLASVGLYGITAYSVARRTSEIGVRMALGANRSDIVEMVMRSAFSQVLLGLAIGVPIALLGARLIATQLYGVHAYDGLSLLIAVSVLSAAAAVAGFVPARRASTIEPMQALRSE
ncbi:MAG TPA: ABC transporter permease [Terriglobales bacterium]|nr:ABC transporter permease [Terriglobales bacterium]